MSFRIVSPLWGRKASFGNAGNNEAAIGVAAQHHLTQPLRLHQVDDIGDMRGEVDAGLQQMRALAEAGQGMAVVTQAIGDPPPAPAAVPRAVHQHKSVSHYPPARARR